MGNGTSARGVEGAGAAPGAPPRPGGRLDRGAALALALSIAAYSLLVLPHLRDGVASRDTLGIVQVVNHLLDTGEYRSRPPGHPANEVLVLAPLSAVRRWLGGGRLDGTTYLAYLYASGVACLLLLAALLRRIGTSPLAQLAALLSLATAPGFLIQSIEGHEFLGGIACVLGSVLLLVAYQDGGERRPGRLAASATLAALSTGFRPELAIAGLSFPLYLLWRGRPRWRPWLGALAAAAVTLIVVWLPVILGGHLRGPYPLPHTLVERILGAGYKLAFKAWSAPVAAVLLLSILTASRGARACRERNPSRLWLYWYGPSLTAVLAIAFVAYPTKAEFLLVTLPFLLVTLALGERFVLLGAVTTLTLVTPFVDLDVFRERRLVGPHLAPSAYQVALAEKPRRMLPYLDRVRRLAADPRPTLVIARVHQSFFEFQERATGARPLGRTVLAWGRGRRVVALVDPDAPANLILPGWVMEPGGHAFGDGGIEDLRRYRDQGYRIAADRALFASWRARFSADGTTAAGPVDFAGVRVELFD